MTASGALKEPRRWQGKKLIIKHTNSCMKLTSKKAMSLLALAGMFLASTAVNAATTAYNAGNLILGFRQTGNASSILVNLGAASGYRDGTTTGALSLGNLGLDLDDWWTDQSNGATAWYNDSTVFWGVVGTQGAVSGNGDFANLLYATKPEAVFGTAESSYLRLSSATQSGARQSIENMALAYAGQTSTANSNVALVQLNSASNSWASYNPGGISFSYFSGLEGNFGSGVATAALDLFRMQAGAGATLNTPGTYEGSFTIDSGGVVNFSTSTPGAVPEPSRVLFAGIGLGTLLLRRRRPAVAA